MNNSTYCAEIGTDNFIICNWDVAMYSLHLITSSFHTVEMAIYIAASL